MNESASAGWPGGGAIRGVKEAGVWSMAVSGVEFSRNHTAQVSCARRDLPRPKMQN
jgi:hypothetical protein